MHFPAIYSNCRPLKYFDRLYVKHYEPRSACNLIRVRIVCKNFTKNSFSNTIRVSNSLDQVQALHFVGPALGPNCLKRLSADDNCRQRVKVEVTIGKVSYHWGVGGGGAFDGVNSSQHYNTIL